MRLTAELSRQAACILFLLAAGLAATQQVRADPAVAISECREQSVDQSGFDECLILLAQQAENALSVMEKNWFDVLVADTQTRSEPVALVSPDPEESQDTGSGEATAGETDSTVIAIVNEEALASAGETENLRVINVDEETLLLENSAAAQAEADAATQAATQAARFSELPELFRQYRDQRCDWEAAMQGADRAKGFNLACNIALNRQRVLQLRRLLVEKKAAQVSGQSYRGYFVKTDSGGSFQSCDRRQDWWVTGTDDVLDTLQRRYTDIAAENLEMVYVELRGRAGKSVDSGPGADFVGAVEVTAVNLMRPILEHDCRTVVPTNSIAELATDDQYVDDELPYSEDIEEPKKVPAVTVDDLGDAGFLYGYFSNWMSACAVDMLTVCQAQTQAEYSSEGEWQLAVDRSSKSDWRVRLIPTTQSHLTNGPLQLTVDGIENTRLSIVAEEIEIGRGVMVARGQRGRQLLSEMRAGQVVDFEWIRPDQASAKVSFSLTGITRALHYFNQAEK